MGRQGRLNYGLLGSICPGLTSLDLVGKLPGKMEMKSVLGVLIFMTSVSVYAQESGQSQNTQRPPVSVPT